MANRSFGPGASAVALAAALLVVEGAAIAQATKKAPAGSTKSAAAGPDASGVKVELVALQVGKPSPGDKNPPGMMGGRIMRMNRMDREGTLLTVVVQAAGKRFVEFDEKASKLTALKDDKGTDLSKAKAKAAASPFGNLLGGMGPGAEGPLSGLVDNDGGRCTVDVAGPRTPAAGAGKITLKATLVLKVGASEKVAEQKDVALTAGSQITAGPVPMTVEENKGFPGFGGFPGAGQKTTVALGSKGPTSAIKELAFLDADGKPIPSQVVAQMNGAAFGRGGVQTIYALDKKVDRVGVKVTYYDKIESLTVPVAIETGVGF